MKIMDGDGKNIEIRSQSLGNCPDIFIMRSLENLGVEVTRFLCQDS